MQVPANFEQAIGESVDSAIDVIIEAYQYVSLTHDSLPSYLATKLTGAFNVLQTLFPSVRLPDTYDSSDRLLVGLNMLFRELVGHADGPVYDEWHARVRARLYSTEVRSRLKQVVSDSAFQSVSAADPEPLSVIMSQNTLRTISVGGQQVSVYGYESALPEMLRLQSRPTDALRSAVQYRRSAVGRIRALQEALEPLATKSPYLMVRPVYNQTIGGFGGGAYGAVFAGQIDPTALMNDALQNAMLVSNVAAAGGVIIRHGENADMCATYLQYGGNGLIGYAFVNVVTAARAGETLRGMVSARTTGLATNIDGDFEIDVGGVFVTFTEVELTAGNVVKQLAGVGDATAAFVLDTATHKRVTWSLTLSADLAVAFRTIKRYTVAPIAAQQFVHIAHYFTPDTGEVEETSDAAVLRILADAPFGPMVRDYIALRNRLLTEVTPHEHWKPYFPLLFGTAAARAIFQAGGPLPEAQLQRLYSTLRTPALWYLIPSPLKLVGKMYDDIGSLLALAQVSPV